MDGGADFEAFAALLRRGRDVPEMVGNLAERLEQALPDQVDIKRSGLRRRVDELVVNFRQRHFRVEVHGHGAVGWVDHVVRGINVRSDEVDFDEWLRELALALAEEATESTQVRLALQAALGP